MSLSIEGQCHRVRLTPGFNYQVLRPSLVTGTGTRDVSSGS